MNKARIGMVSLLWGLCASCATAQPPVQPAGPPPGRGACLDQRPAGRNFMSKLDVNRDRRVSRREFLRIFRDMDKDGNGYITANEAPKGPPKGRGARGPRPGAGRRPRNFMSDLDSNRDGRVGPNEFDGPMEHFHRFDRDGNGYVTADEAPNGPPPGEEPPGPGGPGRPGPDAPLLHED